MLVSLFFYNAVHCLLSVTAEFDEAAELLSADPGASTLAMPASPTIPGVQDVRLDLSDNEEGQEESSEVCESISMVTRVKMF